MSFIKGVAYNFKGLKMGIGTPHLLLWGLLRFLIVISLTVAFAGLVLFYHGEILGVIWDKPESAWIVWLWHLLSWLLTLLLIAVSTIFAYLISQIFFSVLIMDHMSRLTEQIVTGKTTEGENTHFWSMFFHLIKQEIPRSLIPVALSLLIMMVGWFTPAGPFIAILSSAVAAVFLAWDNTDLIPARQMLPFKTRFKTVTGALPFHLGFGLPLLIPGLNILMLSFAPVGATLYYLDRNVDSDSNPGNICKNISEGKKPSGNHDLCKLQPHPQRNH